MTKEVTYDVHKTVKRIHNNLDQVAFVADVAKTVRTDNEFALFNAVLDKITNDSVHELQPRWIDRLAGEDVWLPSHVRTALVYVRWDDRE